KSCHRRLRRIHRSAVQNSGFGMLVLRQEVRLAGSCRRRVLLELSQTIGRVAARSFEHRLRDWRSKLQADRKTFAPAHVGEAVAIHPAQDADQELVLHRHRDFRAHSRQILENDRKGTVEGDQPRWYSQPVSRRLTAAERLNFVRCFPHGGGNKGTWLTTG